jgi:hypothetical protein
VNAAGALHLIFNLSQNGFLKSLAISVGILVSQTICSFSQALTIKNNYYNVDVDMNTSDTTEYIICGYFYQVISSSDSKI